jgi:hypothetical protein
LRTLSVSRPDSVDDRKINECGAIGGTGKGKKALEGNPPSAILFITVAYGLTWD